MDKLPGTAAKGLRSLRRGRQTAPTQIYHVTTVTKDREKLLLNLAHGRIVVEALRRETDAGNCDTLCFVVMPDHMHWLMRLAKAVSLSTCVNNVKSRSARRLNLARGCRGPVWQRGFYDRALRRDEDVVEVARYIVANPIRAGLVRRIGDYPLWDAIWVNAFS